MILLKWDVLQKGLINQAEDDFQSTQSLVKKFLILIALVFGWCDELPVYAHSRLNIIFLLFFSINFVNFICFLYSSFAFYFISWVIFFPVKSCLIIVLFFLFRNLLYLIILFINYLNSDWLPVHALHKKKNLLFLIWILRWTSSLCARIHF